MSDFVQTMKDWRRMCKAFTTDDDSCCYGCPVVDLHEHGCEAIFEMDDGTDWERYEGQIREWVAEHPEPVYPTWAEWLISIGAFDSPTHEEKEFTMVEVLYKMRDKMFKPISADIAQKLGIEPKEGV